MRPGPREAPWNAEGNKEFSIKGDVVDMGVGVMIGAAFATIVTSFVEDLVNPLIGLLTGGIGISGLFPNLSRREVASAAQARSDGLAVIAYGVFINAIITFLIEARAPLFAVKGVDTLRREAEKAPAAPPEPPAEVRLLSEIRDIPKR